MRAHWTAIAPIHYDWALPVGLTLPHRFAEGVTLAKIPGWVTSEDVLDLLSYPSRIKLKQDTAYCISVDYQAEEESLSRSIKDVKFDLIKDVNYSLWLARPTGLGFFCVIFGRKTNHEWLWKKLFEVESTYPVPNYARDQLDAEDFVKASKLFSGFQALFPGGTLRMATDAAVVALTQKEWPLRFLLFWLVIESLFGPEAAREMTFRLSQRVALFLEGKNSSKAREIFEQVKASYGWRSKLVHGLRLSKLKSEESRELIVCLEEIIRQSMLKILGDPELVKCFNSKERETFLDGLAFASVVENQ